MSSLDMFLATQPSFGLSTQGDEPSKETKVAPAPAFHMNKEQWEFLLKIHSKSGLYNMMDTAVVDKLKAKFGINIAAADAVMDEYLEKYEQLEAHFSKKPSCE